MTHAHAVVERNIKSVMGDKAKKKEQFKVMLSTFAPLAVEDPERVPQVPRDEGVHHDDNWQEHEVGGSLNPVHTAPPE